MFRTTLHRVRHDLRRLILTAFTVALGVMFLVGALVLDTSTRAALERSYELIYAGADVVVRAPGGLEAGPGDPLRPLDDAVVERVAAVPGVATVEGRTRALGQVLLGDEDGGPAVVTAVPSDPADAAIEVRQGALPTATSEVAIDAELASRFDLGPGDRLTLLLNDGPATLDISAVVGFGGLDGLAGGAQLLVDAASAPELVGPTTELLVTGTAPPAELVERIDDAVGDAEAAITAEGLAASDAAAAGAMTAAVGYVLLGVALLALLVGGFLIANTLRILVTQRIRQLALLRAVGATRRQVAGTILLEAGLTGLSGAIVGSLAGVGIGAALVELSGGLLPGVPAADAAITAAPPVIGIAVGLVVSLIASRGAIRRALGVAPVEAMRTADLGDRPPRRSRLVIGLLLTTLGIALTVVAGGSVPLVVAIGGIAVILGAGVLFPFVTAPLLRALSRPLERLGTSATLARQQALDAPRRTGATASALAVSLGLIAFLLTVGASLGAASPSIVSDRQHAELVVRSEAPWGLQGYLEDVAVQARDVPGVAHAEAVAYGDVAVATGGPEGFRDTAYHAVDPGVVGALVDIRSVDGDLTSAGQGEAAVRARVAEANGWRPGDEVAVRFPDGTQTTVGIVATFEGGVTTDWLLPPDTAEPHLAAAGRDVLVKLEDGADVSAVRERLEGIADQHALTSVFDQAELEAQVSEANESTFGVLAALLSLAVLVAVLGVLNTLNLAVTERIRELGLLRAVGATRRQVKAMVRWEALLLSALGAGIGAVLGIGLAWIATRAFTEFTLPFTIPAAPVAGAVLATLVLGTAASLLPARRAARIPLLTALEEA
jgi:putative ABC transport system permease protein